MNDNNKQQLEQQLWNIANTLRGEMGADDFNSKSILLSRLEL